MPSQERNEGVIRDVDETKRIAQMAGGTKGVRALSSFLGNCPRGALNSTVEAGRLFFII